jgi:DNA-binding NarL/FixJ family response regulator
MITIVLADRSNIIRYGLRSLLDQYSDFRIVGEAAGGLEAIQFTNHLKPNVIIVDWALARRAKMEMIRRIQQRSPATQIILFCLDWDQSQFLDAEECRDLDLVYCDSIGAEVVRTIREGPMSRPCLVALTPMASVSRRQSVAYAPSVA